MENEREKRARQLGLKDSNRIYYQQVWGFDPVNAMQGHPLTQFWYEESFSLVNDPLLDVAGVKIGAKVEVESDNIVRNRIIFGRNNQQAVVECTHTIVYSFTPGEEDPAKDEEGKSISGLNENQPIQLPPWEHFVALKSYVAGIAEIGI